MCLCVYVYVCVRARARYGFVVRFALVRRSPIVIRSRFLVDDHLLLLSYPWCCHIRFLLFSHFAKPLEKTRQKDFSPRAIIVFPSTPPAITQGIVYRWSLFLLQQGESSFRVKYHDTFASINPEIRFYACCRDAIIITVSELNVFDVY